MLIPRRDVTERNKIQKTRRRRRVILVGQTTESKRGIGIII
jgi:hypothetical protein